MKPGIKAQQRILRQLAFLEENRDKMVIDADTHATDTSSLYYELMRRYSSEANYYHGRPVSAEDLLAEMKMAEVDMALIWQNPAATPYWEDPKKNFHSLLEANRYIYNSAVNYPEKFIPAGWTDPGSLGLVAARELARICICEFGFAIVKMNPAQNTYPIDSNMVIEVVDYIVQLGGIPAFHFGADTKFTPAEGLAALAQRHPDHPIIGVHMGGGGAAYPEAEELYTKARALGLEHPNIRFVLSAKRDTHVESDLITYTQAGEPFRNNLFCGSDAPYGRMTWNFGGYRSMFRSLVNGKEHTDSRVRENPDLFTESQARKYMGGNLADFMIIAYRGLLKKSE